MRQVDLEDGAVGIVGISGKYLFATAGTDEPAERPKKFIPPERPVKPKKGTPKGKDPGPFSVTAPFPPEFS